ncbi:MAG: AMP-binding protein [Victivallales bacterium]|nr:AMP-binding protein [Victivallales bacterium]
MNGLDIQMKHNLGQYFDEWCARKPELPALMTMENDGLLKISYAQLHADAMAWAAFLAEKGVKKGDRVAFIGTKNLRHFYFFYACWNLGAIAVPVCETLGDPEMSFVLKDCAPTLVIADKQFLKKATANAGEIPVIPLDELPFKAPLDTKPLPPADVDIDAISVLIYTSGSTGMPKGVMLSHKNIYTNAYWALDAYHVDESDSLISLLPYWHTYALTCEILCVIMASAICIVPKDIRDFKKNLANYKPTIMIAVPRIVETFKAAIDKQISSLPAKKKELVEKAIYNASRIFTAGPRLNGGMLRMVTHKLFYDPLVFKKFRQALGGRLRFIVVGGAPMDLEISIFFKFMGILTLVGYGLTETSPVISCNRPENHKLSTCGTPMPWVTPNFNGDFIFKDDDGNLGKDVHGQLLVKGDCVMKGYWNHTDASAKSFEDGWLNTGDMGFLDKDGFISIQGRKGNMIVLFGGEKLHPEHIEDAVKNSPYITEAMVIGEKCKSIYVCVNVAADEVKGMSEAEILEKVKEEVHKYTKDLAAYQKPRDVLILPEFNAEDGTMTATLKIRRFKVKELYRDKIEAFLQANGEEIATKHDVTIASSRIQESLSK